MKIDWVECNLPWRSDVQLERPPFPDLSEKERQIFGRSLEELGDEYEADLMLYSSLRDKIYEESSALPYEEQEKFKKEKFEELKNSSAERARQEYANLRNKITDWADQQPEWIEFKAKNKEISEEQNKLSFSRSLAKPGVLIQLSDNSIHLLGSVNLLGGACDDCMGFDDSLTVVRYANIVSLEDIRKIGGEV